MKTIKYILLGLIIIMILFSCSTKQDQIKEQHEIVLQSFNAPSSLLSESESIIANRLRLLNIKDFTIEMNVGQSQLVVRINEDVDVKYLSEILPLQGKLDFYETYNASEISSNFDKLRNLDCVKQSLALLSVDDKIMNTSYVGFGAAQTNDTATIGKCFRSSAVVSAFPGNLRFIWGSSAEDNGKYELYLVKVENTGIDEQSIKEASLSGDKSNPSVSMVFKDECKSVWENLSKNNIDRSIAFVVDGKVYSAPVVRSIISSGRSEITGNFTVREANRLSAIISCGKMPLMFEVFSYK